VIEKSRAKRPVLATDRRQAILDAALAAFNENGVAATTVEDVRRRSGASVGSIYHHFGGKNELAQELYLEILRDYQRGFLRVLRRERDPERGIKGLVRHHLRWVRRNPERARYLLRGRPPHSDALRELNRQLFRATAEWLEPHVEAGRVRRLPLDLTYAIMAGPAQEFSRHWLEGRMRSPVGEAERALADAAWRALAVEGGE
jgi:AcrR family transcriptional regulator